MIRRRRTDRRGARGAALLLGVLLLVIGGCARSAPVDRPEKTAITVTGLPIGDVAPLHLAQQQGLLRAQGLDVTIKTLPSSNLALPGLADGSIDIVAGGNYVDTQAHIAASGQDVRGERSSVLVDALEVEDRDGGVESSCRSSGEEGRTRSPSSAGRCGCSPPPRHQPARRERPADEPEDDFIGRVEHSRATDEERHEHTENGRGARDPCHDPEGEVRLGAAKRRITRVLPELSEAVISPSAVTAPSRSSTGSSPQTDRRDGCRAAAARPATLTRARW